MDHKKHEPKLEQLSKLIVENASIQDIFQFLDGEPGLREYLQRNDIFNNTNFYVVPPLHGKSTLQRPDLLKVLLGKYEFHPNARWITSKGSMTPLHWAIEKSRPESVRILLDHNADPKLGAITWDGRPFDSAMGLAEMLGGREEIKKILQEAAKGKCGTTGVQL